MDIKTEVIFDHGTADYIFSLKKRKYIELDGIKQYIGEPIRQAVTPLDIDKVIAFVDEEQGEMTARALTAYLRKPRHNIIKILNTLWTDEVKASYKRKKETLEEQQN